MTWKLGQTSRQYEVGSRGDAGTVSSGRGDYGGVSYGLYQMSSKQGTVGKFVDLYYKDFFKGTEPGTPEFSSRWKTLAREDSTFADKQHDFIKKTHYDPQIQNLKQRGIDLTQRGPAVQDAIWSTSVQFGGGTSIIRRALSRFNNINDVSDDKIIEAIQDYKIVNNSSLFRSSSSSVRKSTLNRAKEEKESLLTLLKEQPQPLIAALETIFDAFEEKGLTHRHT